MTKGEAPQILLQSVCEEDSTEHPCFLEPSEPLHDSDRLLDPLFGVQVTRTGVRRREVAISAQPILDTHRIQQRHHLGRSVTFKGAFPWESSKSG